MHDLPRPIRLLKGAALTDGSVVDVELADGVVADVAPARSAAAGPDVLDLDGFVLLTAPAEPHAHLDKALSWDAIRPPMGDLVLAITSWRAYAATMTVDDIAQRARRQALAMLANGTTAIRTHVDVLLGDEPLRGAEALVRVRDELRDLVDLQIVALAGPESTTEALEAALDLGVDVVGGAPHLAPDPIGDLRRLLEVAERRALPVDLHTDESLTGADTMAEFARITRDWTQNLSAGHCVRLGMMQPAELEPLLAEVLASRIGVIANPITNLYLQGWEHPVATPRGLTAARAALDAGVRFAAGADNVRDPFNPLGRSDALETAMLLVTAAHLTIDEAYTAVSTGAREVLDLPPAGPVVGAQAELLAVRGGSLADVVANAPADRLVIHRGRLVAETATTRRIAAPSPAPIPVPAP